MEKKLFIMDIDGTLAVGSRLLPGAADLIAEIRRQGGRCCFLQIILPGGLQNIRKNSGYGESQQKRKSFLRLGRMRFTG